MEGVKAPTRSTCVPGLNSAPLTSGLVAIVAAECGLEVFRHSRMMALARELGGDLFGIRRRPVPYQDLADRPDRRMCPRQELPHGAGADDQQLRRILAREIVGRQRRGRGRAPLRQPLPVDQCPRLPGDAVEQQIDAHHRRLADGVVVWRDGDDLDSDITVLRRAGGGKIRPGRHQKQRRSRTAWPLDCVVVADRLDRAGLERGAQGLD
jgi:hypothetical protein